MSTTDPAMWVGEPEPPEVAAANSRIGVRLLASALVFLFMAFVFAFFYLRALNSNDDFHPANVNPQQGYGIAILVLVLAATVVLDRARRALAADAASGWRLLSGLALALALAVFIIAVIQYIELPFKTASGGYASVFWGWTAVWLLCWLAVIYWLETLVAQTVRHARTDEHMVIQKSSADAAIVLTATLAAVQVVLYICLYLIK